MTESLFEELVQAVMELDEGRAVTLTEEGLASGLEPLQLLERGLTPGLRRIGDEFEAGERFIPELVLAAGVVDAAVRVLEPEIARRGETRQVRGRVVIGTVQGDIHDIGKNIVAMMLRASGFEVYDLGSDVPAHKFASEARRLNADIIGASALLTTTMGKQRELIQFLIEEGVRDRFRVMIGGAPTGDQWAREIGADAYAANASEAVHAARRLMSG
jgi:corrinoid protein of di/trimethylamine methyltransferase